MTNIFDIINRIKKITGLKRDNAVAELLGLSPSQLSNIKRATKGKISDDKQGKNLPYRQLIDWATENDVDLNWLFSGQAKEDGHKPWVLALEPQRHILDSLSEEEATCLVDGVKLLLRFKEADSQPVTEKKGRPQKAVKK